MNQKYIEPTINILSDIILLEIILIVLLVAAFLIMFLSAAASTIVDATVVACVQGDVCVI